MGRGWVVLLEGLWIGSAQAEPEAFCELVLSSSMLAVRLRPGRSRVAPPERAARSRMTDST